MEHPEKFVWRERPRPSDNAINHDPYLVCPMCAASVPKTLTRKHEAWHRAIGIDGLQREVMDIGRS